MSKSWAIEEKEKKKITKTCISSRNSKQSICWGLFNYGNKRTPARPEAHWWPLLANVVICKLVRWNTISILVLLLVNLYISYNWIKVWILSYMKCWVLESFKLEHDLLDLNFIKWKYISIRNLPTENETQFRLTLTKWEAYGLIYQK